MSAYGYSAYDSGFLFRNKIYPLTAHNYYGLSLYTPLNVNPFTAVPRDYTTIMLQWTQPQGGDLMDFRLLSNRYGYPVDENDGNIIIDSASYPGSSYADLDVIPGQYHYYGIYLLNQGVWNRAGFASCLAPFNYASGARMFSLLPVYFEEIADAELTQESANNTTLSTWLDIPGWSFDYLRTQYDMLAKHLNDPMMIPLGDLQNLAAQLGMPYQPEVPASVMRKAVANWTHICQERGTPAGLSEHITLLTGYPVDLRSGRNIMLENDQAGPVDPAPNQWLSNLSYAVGEMVTYENYIYTCILAGGVGTSPTGTTSANTYWTNAKNLTDPGLTLANPATIGGVSTWEAILPALDAGGTYTPAAGTLVNTLGLPDPKASSSITHSAFSVFNTAATTQDIMLRSVSRIASDMTGANTNIVPDPLQAAGDGIPVPRVTLSTNEWLSSVRYPTDTIIYYDGLLYQALRASTGATPPSPGTPLNANPYLETTVAPWAVYGGGAATSSTTVAFQGTHSLLVTPNGTTATPGALSENITVIPGATYTFSPWLYTSAAYSSGASIGIKWYDAFSQLISTSSQTLASSPATTWTNVSLTAVAPANAASGYLFVQMTGTPAGSLLSYWDSLVLSCQQTPEWQLLSPDNRLRFMISGYTAAPGSATVGVIPYIEWYDESGVIISSNGQYRVTPRTASPGVAGIVPSLTFDSFATASGSFLNGRQTDTKDQVWSTLTGSWAVSEFFGGSIYPAAAGTRSMAVATGGSGVSTPVYLGATIVTAPGSGQDAGIVFRVSSISSYWRAGMTGLYKITAGASALVGTYSTAFSPGDRMVVYLNGNSITVYRNGASVYSDSDSYNASATLHGVVVEGTGV